MDWMDLALKIAAQGEYSCLPNPMVGCVVVKNNTLIGQGAHLKAGEGHAEVLALTQAGKAAQGADVYVTLEPCSHFGRTPPCVDLLLACQVKSVHIAILDPNPQVAGKGAQKLKDAGIEVTIGTHQERAYKLNEKFFYYITQKKPFVIAKWAMTLDGKIATQEGHSQWITSNAALTHAHTLRAQVGAIMVGAQTLRHDNPSLNVRHVPTTRQPRAVVLTASNQLPLEAHLLQKGANTLVIMSENNSEKTAQVLHQRGIEYVCMPLFEGLFNLNDVLLQLGKREISSLLIEGGEKLLTQFFEQNLIHRYAVYLAPKILGGKNSRTPLAGVNKKSMHEALVLCEPEIIPLLPDVCFLADAPHTPQNFAQFKENYGVDYV